MNQTRFNPLLSSYWTALVLTLMLTGNSLASEPGETPETNEIEEETKAPPVTSDGTKPAPSDDQNKVEETEDDDEDDDEIFDGEATETPTTPSYQPIAEGSKDDKNATAAPKGTATVKREPPATQTNESNEPAPESTPIKTLDVITIIGNQEKLQRASGSAFKVSKKLLETQEHDDVHRVLKQVPGVYIRDEDGFGLRPNIGLRGASSDRSAKVSLMEDGVLMAPAPYAAPAAYYFPLTTRLSGMEVFKGPSAIKYGPNTIGGALNFTTRASVPRGQRGEIDLAMGSFGAQKVHAYFGQGARGFGYVIEGARIDSNGFKDLDTGQNTGFQKDDWMIKGHVQSQTTAGVFHRLELKLGFAQEQSSETYLGLTDEDFNATPYRRYAASQLGNMEWARTQAKLHYTGLIGEDIEWNITGYRHDFTRAWRKLNALSSRSGVDLYEALLDPTNVRYRPFIEILKGTSEWSQDPSERLVIGTNDRDYISQGIQSKVEFTHRFDTFRHTAEVGLRAHYDEIQRNHSEAEYDMIESTTVRATPDDLVRQNTGKALAFSGYLFNELSWGERFILTPGIRLESYSMSLEDRQNDSPIARNDETIWLPGIGVWGGLSESVGLLAGVHRGFSPVAPGQPADTRSETSLNYEAGVRWQMEQFHGEVVGFFNQYENLTGTCTQSAGCDPDALDEQFNAGRADIMGLEAVLKARFGLGNGARVTMQAAYTWTHAQFQSDFQSGFAQWGDVQKGDLFPYVPAHQGSLGLGLEKGPFTVDLNATFVAEMRDVAGQGDVEDKELIPANKVFDLAAGYRPRKGTKLYLKVENLLNEAYMVSRRPFGARPGKPNQIIVGLKQAL